MKPYRPQVGAALTETEAAHLRSIIAGMSIVEIAKATGNAASTVATHIARARAKLGAKTTERAAVLFDRGERIVQQTSSTRTHKIA